MDKKPIISDNFMQAPVIEENRKSRSKKNKKNYFQHRSGSHGKEHLPNIDDEPINSYVPQTLTFQQHADMTKQITPLNIPVKNLHRSAEEEKLNFTGQKDRENRAHSVKERSNTKNFESYLSKKRKSKFKNP